MLSVVCSPQLQVDTHLCPNLDHGTVEGIGRFEMPYNQIAFEIMGYSLTTY